MIDLKANPFFLDDESIRWVEDNLSQMSAEEKVGQLFCMILRDEQGWRDTADNLLRLKPGGVMFRPLEKKTARDAAGYFQENSSIPMLIAANLERGGSGILKEGTNYACNMQVAAAGDPGFAADLAEVCAEEASAIGGNWAFAPVIDIDYNFRNPITNTRTFGSNPELVSALGVEYVRHIQKKGIAACIKHFPGDGVDERDQHLVASVNSMQPQQWDETFGKVNGAGIEAGALTAMAGHIMLPEYSRKLRPGIQDSDIQVASLSEELLNDLLRGSLGFNGLIVTDATTMTGMMQSMPRSLAVPSAIAAGCDMFLFTRNLEEDIQYMKEGVESGIISNKRLDEAVTRILAVKAALKLHLKKTDGVFLPPAAALEKVGCSRHLELARRCADHAITLVKSDGTLPLKAEADARILLHVVGDQDGYGNIKGGKSGYFLQKLQDEGFTVDIFDVNAGHEGFLQSYSENVEIYDYILYFCALATKSNQTTVRIEWAQPMGLNCPCYIPSIPTVFISMENPYHLLDVPGVKTFINAYTNTNEVIDSLVEKLMGRSEFIGRSPVDPFCGKWDTRL